MKRLLLFSIVLATTGSLLAQTSQNIQLQRVVRNASIFSADPPSNFTGAPLNRSIYLNHPLFSGKISARSGGVTFNPFASSANINTVLVSQENCLNSNQGLNLIAFTHRACDSYVTSGGGNSGWINTSYSTDGGNTWDTSLLVMNIGHTSTDTACRYPSGTIYNPIGNSTAANAYTVVAGPITNNTSWSGYFFGSSTFGGSNNNQQVDLIVDTPIVYNEYMPRIGMTSAGNHLFVLGVDQVIVTTGSDGPFKGLVLNTGTFNSNNNAFTWSFQNIHPSVAINPRDTALFLGGNDMAWSAGGDTGYIVQFGVDSAQYASAGTAGFYPIVYKSVDSGKTWSKLPFYNFNSLTAISSLMRRPNCLPSINALNGSKCVVDYQGNLHIITDIESGSGNADSLDYSYFVPGYIFDLSTSSGTSWNAVFIDTIFSEPGVNPTSPVWTESGTTSPAVSARIQASITPDRTKVFISWLDTDPALGDNYNELPDIFSKGLDYTNSYITPVVNFTSTSAYAEGCYWLYAANFAFSNSGTYTIPATITLPQNYNVNGYNGADPVEHYYVSGISFTDSDFSVTGIHTIANSILGMAIYPNPSNGNINISFTKYTGQASLTVTNLLGQTVKQFNNVNVGSNNLQLNLSDLISGIYFVKIETNQGSETQKVIISNKN